MIKNLRYLTKGCVAAGCIAVGLIMPWEQLRTKAYLDDVKIPTICYGYTRNVRLGDIKDENECTHLLFAEVNRIDAIVSKEVHVALPNHVRAALISFIYNVGEGAFRSSSTLQRLNRGDIRGGCEALATKTYDANGVCRGYGCGWAGGKMLRGLQDRRIEEKLMCLGEIKL